jgi:hypothetical protein
LRFDHVTQILEATSQDLHLPFEAFDRLLKLVHLTTTLQFTSGRLQEAPVRQIKGLADGQRDLFGLGARRVK